MVLKRFSGAERRIEEVRALLDRRTNIDSLSSLVKALRFELTPVPLAETVIAFDTNAFLRLASHRRCDDIVDALRTSFPGKIILPGQVVQEFWNGQLSVLLTVADNVKTKLGDLEKSLDGLDERFGDFSLRFKENLDNFKDNFGYIFEDNTVRRTRLFVDLLSERASVPYAPRDKLYGTALARKKTKTPPGFKDDSDGDFFVWADLLLGLASLRAARATVSRVALVTLEKKIDWSRDGVPHPILSSEISAICGANFEILTIEGLAARLLD